VPVCLYTPAWHQLSTLPPLLVQLARRLQPGTLPDQIADWPPMVPYTLRQQLYVPDYIVQIVPSQLLSAIQDVKEMKL
jgi:hypothetical protein